MSDTVTMTLSEFLLARILELEDAARRALDATGGIQEGWTLNVVRQLALGGFSNAIVVQASYAEPSSVLAECEAKRRIVEALTAAIEYDESVHEAWTTTATEGARVLNHLSAVYADHPDYREEWKP